MSISLPPPDPQALMRASENMEVSDFGSVKGNADSAEAASAKNLTSTDISTLIASNREGGTKSYEELRVFLLTADSPTLIEATAVENYATVMDEYSNNFKKAGAKAQTGEVDGETILTSQGFKTDGVTSKATANSGAAADSGQVRETSTASVNLNPTEKGNEWFAPSIMATIAKYMSEIIKVSMDSALKESQMSIMFFSLMGETAKDIKALTLAAAKAESQKERNNAISSFISAGAAVGSAGFTLGAMGGTNTIKNNKIKTETAKVQSQKDKADANVKTQREEAAKQKGIMDKADQDINTIRTKSGQFAPTDKANSTNLTPKDQADIQRLESKKASAKTLHDDANSNARQSEGDAAEHQRTIDGVQDRAQNKQSTDMQIANNLIRDGKEIVSGFGDGTMKLYNSELTLEAGSSTAMAKYLDLFRDMYNQLYSQSKDQQKGIEDQINSVIQTWTKIADTNKESFAIKSH